MKFCSKCGKELLDEAVICVGCGCAVSNNKPYKVDYKAILRSTKTCFVIGLVLLVFGVFAWAATDLLGGLYVVIGEYIHDLTSEGFPSRDAYDTWYMMAGYSSIVFFFAAEMVFLIPKNKFNSAFKRENGQILHNEGKAEYKKAARKKNAEMNKESLCYRFCWIMAIISCVLFVVSIIMPSCIGV